MSFAPRRGEVDIVAVILQRQGQDGGDGQARVAVLGTMADAPVRGNVDALLADEVEWIHAADVVPGRHGRTHFLIARQGKASEVARCVVRRAELVVLTGTQVELIEGRRCLEARRPGRVLREVHILDETVLDDQPVEAREVFARIEGRLCRGGVDGLDVIGEAARAILIEHQGVSLTVLKAQAVDVVGEQCLELIRGYALFLCHLRAGARLRRRIRGAIRHHAAIALHNGPRAKRHDHVASLDGARHGARLQRQQRAHRGTALMCLVNAVEHPLVGHVGMVEVRDWAVVHRGEDVVSLVGRADGLELSGVLPAVARRAEQCG